MTLNLLGNLRPKGEELKKKGDRQLQRTGEALIGRRGGGGGVRPSPLPNRNLFDTNRNGA